MLLCSVLECYGLPSDDGYHLPRYVPVPVEAPSSLT